MIGRSLLVVALIGFALGCATQDANTPAPNWAAAPPAPYGYGAPQLPPAGAPPPPYGYPAETYDTGVYVSAGVSGGTYHSPHYQGHAPPPASHGHESSSCKMGSDGRRACGYDCKIGSNGVAACANAPGGSCAIGADGIVYCSETRVSRGGHRGGAKSECKLNADGSQTCGYNCKLGSRGAWYCASDPSGSCRLRSDGSYSCS